MHDILSVAVDSLIEEGSASSQEPGGGRAPGELVEPFRARTAAAAGRPLAARLAAWARQAKAALGVIPDMPDGVTDRPADVWEPLLAVADAAWGDWPQRARAACTEMAAAAETAEASLGVRLLADLGDVFAIRDSDGNPTGEHAESLPTAEILGQLYKLEEAPWAALGKLGKPLDARGLATRLRGYGIKSGNVRRGETVAKGYRAEDLADSWSRYVPGIRASATSATPLQPQAADLFSVADAVAVADTSATPLPAATDPEPLTSDVTHVADVADLREPEAAPCTVCGWPVGSNGCTHTCARRSTNRCVVCGKHREYIAPDGLPYCAACRTPEPTGPAGPDTHTPEAT